MNNRFCSVIIYTNQNCTRQWRPWHFFIRIEVLSHLKTRSVKDKGESFYPFGFNFKWEFDRIRYWFSQGWKHTMNQSKRIILIFAVSNLPTQLINFPWIFLYRFLSCMDGGYLSYLLRNFLIHIQKFLLKKKTILVHLWLLRSLCYPSHISPAMLLASSGGATNWFIFL